MRSNRRSPAGGDQDGSDTLRNTGRGCGEATAGKVFFLSTRPERVAFDWTRAFTRHPEAAIARANAFGVLRELD